MQREIPEGLHARYEHQRNFNVFRLNFRTESRSIDPRGGKTICYLENDNNEVVATGVARCSDEDSYVKKIGRDISLGRALKELADRSETMV